MDPLRFRNVVSAARSLSTLVVRNICSDAMLKLIAGMQAVENLRAQNAAAKPSNNGATGLSGDGKNGGDGSSEGNKGWQRRQRRLGATP